MLDLDAITARAKDAPRQTTDVEVVFDAGLTEELEAVKTQRAEVQEQLDAIDAALTAELEGLEKDRRAGDGRQAAAREAADVEAAPLRARLDDLQAQVEDVQARAADFLVTFRLTALHGFEWNDLCGMSVPRANVAEDAGRGYNFDEVTKTAAARSGVRVGDDGDLIDVSPEQWKSVWETLPAPGLNQIKMAVWYLNEYAWVQARDEAVVAARKVLRDRQAATRPSPSTSASTPADSPAGNPSPSPSITTTTTDA